MGLEGGGCKFVIAPLFQKKGGAPAPLHTPLGTGLREVVYISVGCIKCLVWPPEKILVKDDLETE